MRHRITLILLSVSILSGCSEMKYTEESSMQRTETATEIITEAVNETSCEATTKATTEAVTKASVETTTEASTEIITETAIETSEEKTPQKSLALVKVMINTNDRCGSSLEKANGYVDTSVIIVDVNGKVVSEEKTAKIKVRGNTTSLADKKPYTIKFSEKQNVCGMGAAKKWTLLAENYDPSLMRNYIALNLAKELGINYTSDSTYAEVYMDGEYQGVYLLTEPVEDGKTRVDLKVSDGDFLIMLELSRKEKGVSYVKTTNNYRFKIVEPSTTSFEQRRTIRKVLNEFEEALKSHDYEKISEYADMESFAKYALLNDYLMTVDIKVSSAYFYYKNGRLYAGPPWDFDLSMGNSSIGDLSKNDFSRMNTCYWFIDLYKTDGFLDKMRELLIEHSEYIYNISSDGGLIDRLLLEYELEFEKNYYATGRTPMDCKCEYNLEPEKTFKQNVILLKKWLSGRYEWFSTEF